MSAWWVVLGCIVAAGTALSAYGNSDVDLFWHRVLGQRWISQLGFDVTNDPIAYTPGRHWVPTSWSVEVAYALLVDHIGYGGVAALRCILALAFLSTLGVVLARRLPVWQAALWLAVVGLPASMVIQDRPQTFSLLLTVLILPAVWAWLERGDLPRPVVALGFTWLWANVHGLWVLPPALLSVAALVAVAQRLPWRRAAALAGGCLLAAALTPIGPELLLTPFRIRSSTAQIAEWTPTAIHAPFTWGFAAVLVALVAMWARRSPAPAELWYSLAVTAFGLLAVRNAVFASLLLLPPLLVALRRAPARSRSTARMARPLVAAVVGLALLAGAATYLRIEPVSDAQPYDIAAALRAADRPLRVVNDYNVSGVLREFGGDRVRLAIDGRSDRYGSGRIDRYGRMLEGQAGWRPRLATLRPDAVVVDRRSALVELLRDDGWTRVMRDGEMALLVPPGRPLGPPGAVPTT